MAHVHYPGLTVIPTGYLRVLVVLSPEVLPPESAAGPTIPCFVLTIIGQWDAILLYLASLLQLPLIINWPRDADFEYMAHPTMTVPV